MHNIIIREIRQEELPLLENMLYEAIYQPDKVNPIPREVINLPEINTYIDGFGEKKDDHCFISESDGKIVGAVWVRILSGEIKGYGNIDEYTPEFAISLYKEYRHRGIGTRLMSTMITYLRDKGYAQTSLHVKKDNYAVKLYRKMGFVVIDEDEEDYLMLLKMNNDE